LYYNIDTTATFSGPAEVCVTYDPTQVPDPGLLEIRHFGPLGWEDITSGPVAGGRICGTTLSFSPFALMIPAAGPVGGAVAITDSPVSGSDGTGVWALATAGLLVVGGAALVAARRRRPAA
jgi:hypothetical protein